MVLSLGFIIAFIGAAVALLIGILIFSEVSDSIICPAGDFIPGTPGSNTTGYTNLGTLGTAGDASYHENQNPSTFVSTAGIINEGVIKNGTASGDTNGEVEFGSDPTTWNFLNNVVGSNITSVNFWLKGDVVGAPVYPMLNTGDADAGNEGFSVYTQSGSFTYLAVRQSGNTVEGNPESHIIPDDASWHMYSLVMDKGNTTGDWYFQCIDGSCLSGTAQNNPFDVAISAPLFNLTLGGGTGKGSAVTQWTLELDEIAIWQGYPLTQSDINTMYNGGAGSTARTIATGSQVLFVSFDDVDAFGGTPGTPSSSTGNGSEECENAKDTAWTVIGILPVALFFALFAIFGALGRNN